MTPFAAAVVVIGTMLAAIVLSRNQGGQFDVQPPSPALPLIVGPISIYPGVPQFAAAIANAEGFGIDGAIPTLAHNPGDLVIPGWTSPTLGEGISVFSSDDEGLARLFHQLDLIASGQSHVYSASDTIRSMAAKWTKTEPDSWAVNVAGYLANSPDDLVVPILLQS
jgi:hypothetical protein